MIDRCGIEDLWIIDRCGTEDLWVNDDTWIYRETIIWHIHRTGYWLPGWDWVQRVVFEFSAVTQEALRVPSTLD